MNCRNCGTEIKVCTGKLGFVGDAIHVDDWFACDHSSTNAIASGNNAEYEDTDFSTLRESFATKRLHIISAPVWDGTTAADLEAARKSDEWCDRTDSASY